MMTKKLNLLMVASAVSYFLENGGKLTEQQEQLMLEIRNMESLQNLFEGEGLDDEAIIDTALNYLKENL